MLKCDIKVKMELLGQRDQQGQSSGMCRVEGTQRTKYERRCPNETHYFEC